LTYRPTVRYDDIFKDYVDDLFNATNLDRNQIIRLGLFLLGHTKEGRDVLNYFSSSPLPEPKWNKNNTVLWYGKEHNYMFPEREDVTAEGGTSNDNKESVSRSERETTRHEHREVYEETTTKKRVKYIARIGDNTTILYQG
jgi:hypothetical protein